MTMVRKVKTFSSVKVSPGAVLICDRQLKGFLHPAHLARFKACLFVQAGESIKTLKSASRLFEFLQKNQAQQVYAMGGGSLTDGVGFVASTYRRGTPLVLIPTTWLSAIDSAIGGKNALNLGKAKNQIGTIYQPQQIYLINEILRSQPERLAEDAWFEAVKIHFLVGCLPRKSVAKAGLAKSRLLWTHLDALIAAKMKVVERDPFEKKGIRHLLNLGHTFAHVIEIPLGLAHGRAVGFGLTFNLLWSVEKKLLSPVACQRLIADYQLPSPNQLSNLMQAISEPGMHLTQDKKMNSKGQIHETFIKGVGRPIMQWVPQKQWLKFWTSHRRATQ